MESRRGLDLQHLHPFVLRPGNLHGRNVIVSHAFSRRILALIDWDFGGSRLLPFADARFEPSWPDSDNNGDVREEQAEVVYYSQILINKTAGELPYDTQLIRLVYWNILEREGEKHGLPR